MFGLIAQLRSRARDVFLPPLRGMVGGEAGRMGGLFPTTDPMGLALDGKKGVSPPIRLAPRATFPRKGGRK